MNSCICCQCGLRFFADDNDRECPNGCGDNIKVLGDAVSKRAHHYRAQKFKKCVCELCGAKGRIHIHHKDRDYTNNTPENCQTLCKPCHVIVHDGKQIF